MPAAGRPGRFFQFFDELIAVEGVEKVDIAGTAVHYFEGKFTASLSYIPVPLPGSDCSRILIAMLS
jgi:hypothetical protein